MNEKHKDKENTQPKGDGFGDAFDGGVPEGGNQVTVGSGVYLEKLPVGGMTVAQIREKYSVIMDIDPAADAFLDGKKVESEAVTHEGQTLRFAHKAGEKESTDMKIEHKNLPVPIYLKLTEDQEWPKDKAFYYITKDGIFLCRNHPFFRSSAKANKLPTGLAGHEAGMKVNYPKVSRVKFEQIIGFFDAIWRKQNSEAAVLLVWNIETQQVDVICPPQVATVGGGWKDWKGKQQRGYPMDVKYDLPALEPHQVLIGDVHSHVEGSAYASMMDENDEKAKPGIHMVVGKIHVEPPDYHIETTADGQRYKVEKLWMVVEGYEKRRSDFPPEWIDQVKCETYTYKSVYSSYADEEWKPAHEDPVTGEWIPGDWVKKTKKGNTTPTSDEDFGWSLQNGKWVNKHDKPKHKEQEHPKNKQTTKKGFFRRLF